MAETRSAVVDEILTLFAERGDSAYGGEAVTQRAHALQAAYFTKLGSNSPALVVAALLHDVGHLLHDLPDDAPDRGVDDRHEDLGARWLAARFGPEVVEPVRLHVEAKRFLCAVTAGYHDTLSAPSQLSLQLQGGPMSAEEAERFQSLPHAEEAAFLRLNDDYAKVPELAVPGIEEYIPLIEQVTIKS